jgi:hypothetical protein
MKSRSQFYIVILMATLFGLHCSCGYGQQSFKDLKNAPPEKRAKFQTNLMKTKLNLDANQANKVQAINLKYAEKFQPIIKSTDSRPVKLKAAMALQKEKDKELQAVFSEEQYKEYIAFEQELRSKLRAAFKKP